MTSLRFRPIHVLIAVFALLFSAVGIGKPVVLTEQEALHLAMPESVWANPDADTAAIRAPLKHELAPISAGDPRTNIWYRVDLRNNSGEKVWYIEASNTLIEQIRVYSIRGGERTHRSAGYQKTHPFDLGNAVAITLPPDQTISVWINLQAPYISQQPLITLMPKGIYHDRYFNFHTLVLIAIGAMLALVVYNAFLYFPTRDASFLWYAGYQVLCMFGWAVHFKIMLYCFDLPLDASTLYLPFFIAGAASLMFAISFLRLPERGWSALLIRAFAIALIVFGLVGLFLPFAQYQQVISACAYAWMFVMLGMGIWRFNKGYRPARIYVLGFSVLTAFFLFTLAGKLAGTSLFDNQMLWALWAQLFDAIALALALADRINFLRKSRQHADKRASTDQLTGLPNRSAFEKDVRAWEAYYSEGVIQEFFLTFIDVDGLKRVNDQCGHNEGDRLLALVAQWLSGQNQQHNVYRIGGDEFVILSKQHIQWDLNSLHSLLLDQGFPNSDVSIGTASYSESGNRSALLKLADERMYAIKHSNR